MLLARCAFLFGEQLDAFFRLRTARNVICLHLLCAGATYSQRTFSSFGPMSDLALEYTPMGLAWLPSSAQIAVLSQESSAVYFYSLDSSATIIQTGVVSTRTHAADIIAESNAANAQDEFALLSTDGTTVLVVRKVEGGYSETSMELDTRSQRIAFGDINSDRRDDLLLFGKKRSGVATLLRQKDGQYGRGMLLFPDVSVSSLQCVDLNADGITDIFMVNWLSNQLDLFYGIGRGVFSEQVEVALPGEPDNIALSPVTNERTVQIAVTIPDQNLVSMFQCNSTGEIETTGSLHLPFPPLQVHFADINGDKDPDLIVTTNRAVYVFLGKPGLQFSQAATFGSGTDVVACSEGDLDEDCKCDLMLVDRATKRLSVFGNSSWSGRVSWPATYATGMNPQGVAVMDVNDDGLPDIAVTNFGSSTLSIFLNQGNGVFQGQRTIAVSERPVAVTVVSPTSRTSHTVLTAHASADKINIVRFIDDMSRTDVAAVPTGSDPHILLAKRDSLSGQLEMLVRNTNPRDGSRSLSLFQQIGGGHLLERSLRASLPGRITALTVDDYSGSGKYELVFATYDKASRQSALSIAFPEQGFDFKTVKLLFSFPDSSGCVRSIISGYVDGDPYKDLVLLLSYPRDALGIVYGKGGGAFKDSIEMIRNVHPLNGDDVLLKDVNADGHNDLTWIDTERKAVLTSFGRGNRRFDPPVVICSANHITAFQVAGMKVPSGHDLILLNGFRGSVTIMFDPFGK